MLTIYFSPHMTSTDNEIGHASGFADVPLTPAGEQLSRELGQHYATYTLDAVFPSDLQRATATAQIAFAARALPIIPDARLRETNYGDLTQSPTSQIDAVLTHHTRIPFPNGESILMAIERTGDFLRDALRDYDGKTILIIGHRATNYALEYYCGDKSLDDTLSLPWEWRDIPIWHYELTIAALERRTPIT